MRNSSLYITLLCLTVLSGGCTQKKQATDRLPIPVVTQTIREGNDQVSRRYLGSLDAKESVSLSFSMGGTITQVYVKPGDRVKAGQVLAELDAQQAENAYKTAQASLTQAQDGYARMKQVYDKGSIAEVKWVEMQTKLAQAEAMCAMSKKNLQDCKLKAPRDGYISSCDLKVGANATPNVPMLQLMGLNPLQVRFQVAEDEIRLIQIGDSIRVLVPSMDSLRLQGRISDRGLQTEQLSHSYTMRADISNPKQQLLPGMSVQIELNSHRTTRGTILPSDAILLATDNSRFVWLMQGDSAVIRPVHIAGFADNGVLVDQGLQLGDKVVIEGYQKICSGTKIQEKNSVSQ